MRGRASHTLGIWTWDMASGAVSRDLAMAQMSRPELTAHLAEGGVTRARCSSPAIAKRRLERGCPALAEPLRHGRVARGQ